MWYLVSAPPGTQPRPIHELLRSENSQTQTRSEHLSKQHSFLEPNYIHRKNIDRVVQDAQQDARHAQNLLLKQLWSLEPQYTKETKMGPNALIVRTWTANT